MIFPRHRFPHQVFLEGHGPVGHYADRGTLSSKYSSVTIPGIGLILCSHSVKFDKTLAYDVFLVGICYGNHPLKITTEHKQTT
jgi:hypothetical protein